MSRWAWPQCQEADDGHGGSRPVIDIVFGQESASTYRRRKSSNLPVNGRNFANLMTLATGATSDGNGGWVERPVQRQVEPAELSELMTAWTGPTSGTRAPATSTLPGSQFQTADVDGIGGRVPRELGPRSGGERARRRRQHHGGEQERRQRVLPGRCSRYKRDDALDAASKYDDKKQPLKLDQFGGLHWRAHWCRTARSSS